jgi:hypothetical protein
MSKGLGKTQRAVLATITNEWRTVADVAAGVSGRPPSRATVESVRRACRRLADGDHVDLDYVSDGRVWSDLGDGRNAYEPGHRPAHPGWQLAVKRKGSDNA